MPDFSALFDDPTGKALATAIALVAAIAAPWFARHALTRSRWSSDAAVRRAYARIRTVALVAAAAVIVAIWSAELRTAALSLVAVAVAVVIAMRETIASFTASLQRASSGAFQIGDRITVGESRGDVIDHSLTQTTLLEIGPTHLRTGRTIVIPNNVLLTEAVLNETAGSDYVLHSFSVLVPCDRWADAERLLLAKAMEISAAYLDDARTAMEDRARRYAITMPVIEPLVLAKVTDATTVCLTVRLPAPSREIWRIEDTITRAWLDATVPVI